MKIFPVVLDSRPAYLGGGSAPGSLLLMPLGVSTLLDHIHRGLADLQQRKVTVVPTFEPTPAYEQAIRAACPTRTWSCTPRISAATCPPTSRRTGSS